MRIAVTGGRGLLGRAVCELAVREGHSVISVDLVSAEADEPTDGLQQVNADVTDFERLRAAVAGAEALVHLAAYISPRNHPDHVVHNTNVVARYNALSVAVTSSIRAVALASSINAIGGQYSRRPRCDYFPVDEEHPTHAEDPYSLSKWLGERQADAFARRHENMTISSLRFHALRSWAEAHVAAQRRPDSSARDLWGHIPIDDAARSCLAAVQADFRGHEVFYVVGDRSTSDRPSLDLRAEYYPDVPVVGDLSGHRGFFDVTKARRLLGLRLRSDVPAPR